MKDNEKMILIIFDWGESTWKSMINAIIFLLYIEVSISIPRAADNSGYFVSVERGPIAAGVILSCALRSCIFALNMNENNGLICSIYRAEIETFVEDKDAENTKRSAKV